MSPTQLSDDALLALIAAAQIKTRITKLSTENVAVRLGKVHDLFSLLQSKPDCAALIYRCPAGGEVTWTAIGERLVVGRSPKVDYDRVGSTLQIDDNELSRLHFEIVHRGDGIYAVNDLKSTNRLYVNEIEEENAVLVSGAEIRAGQTSFIFMGS